MIVESKNVKYIKLQDLITFLKTQKYPQMLNERELRKLSQFPESNLEFKNGRTMTNFYHSYNYIILIIEKCVQNKDKYIETPKPQKVFDKKFV